MPTQPNQTRERVCLAFVAPPSQLGPGGSVPAAPSIVLSPRTPTGQMTTGFLFASSSVVQPTLCTVWKQATAAGRWFPLLVLEAADGWLGEWVTVCDVNATPLYFQVPEGPEGVLIAVEEFGSSPG